MNIADDRCNIENAKANALTHLDAAYNLAFCLMQDQLLAEELVEKAYLRLFRALELRNTVAIKVSLLQAVHALTRDHDRDRDLERERIAATPSLPIAALACDMLAGLVRLPCRLRVALILHDQECLSYADIATVTGVTADDVMSRIALGRRQLLTQSRSAAHSSRPEFDFGDHPSGDHNGSLPSLSNQAALPITKLRPAGRNSCCGDLHQHGSDLSSLPAQSKPGNL